MAVRDDDRSVDSPSKDLLAQLETLGLVSPRDLRQCHRHVRWLARDLPLFDSVWLDALVRGNVLTPFQSRHLQDGTGDRLRIERFTLADELVSDDLPRMFRVRGPQGGQPLLLSTITVPTDIEAALSRLDEVGRQLRECRSADLSIPIQWGRDSDRLFVASPAEGDSRNGEGTHSLHDLLVRRGRLADADVEAIARRLLRVLAEMHSQGVVHGDIRLRNVWLDPVASGRGRLQLMNAGFVAAVRPVVSHHEVWPIEALDGVAPESIGPRGRRTPQSDLYSLGVLLWHLLSGRSPHATVDPLSRLAAHQTRDIVDIRVWAPDTSATLASLIEALVQRDPQRRPTSAEEALAILGRRSRTTSKRANPVEALPTIRGGREASSMGRVAGLAACAVLGLAGTLAWIHRSGGIADPLSVPGPLAAPDRLPASASPPRTANAVDTAPAPPRLRPLPPLKNGEIVLDHPGPWKAGRLAMIGPVRILAAAGVRPVIEIEQEPLHIAAEQVILAGIEFRTAPAAEVKTPSPVLLALDAQRVQIEQCRFVAPDASSPKVLPAAIRWTLIDEAAANGRLLLKKTHFAGDLRGIEPHSRAGVVAADEILKSGRGELISFPDADTSRQQDIHLRRSTLRGACPLVSAARFRSSDRIAVHADHCVFAVEAAALFETTTAEPGSDLRRILTIDPQASLLAFGTPLQGQRLGPNQLDAPQDDSSPPAGLAVDELQFAGDVTGAWEANRLTGTTIPLQEEVPPGIGASPF